MNAFEGKLGTELCEADRRHVLAAYVHRSTQPGGEYPQQFRDDADWLAHTRFAVRGDGRLDGRVRHCYSCPTWPNGVPSELRAKAKAVQHDA